MLSVRELVHMLVDIVSKNGNLLLNVGPMADGTISELQMERLEGLGAWLAINGEAIFGTRPWHAAEGQPCEGISIRFTQKADTLYAILLGIPSSSRYTIKGLHAEPGTIITLLGHHDPVTWVQTGDSITFTFSELLPDTPALVLKISPSPSMLATRGP
jgi:alpha-L-fucosidase